MVSLVISRSDNKRISLRKRTDTYAIPSAWHEIPERSRASVLHTALTYRYPYNWQRILHRHVGIPRSYFKAIPSAQQYDLYEQLAWITGPTEPTPIVPTFTHRGIRYHFPSPKLWNASGMEYAIADESYTEFTQSKDEATLLHLLATLCRPEDSTKTPAEREEDPRISLLNRAEITLRVQDLKDIDPIYIHMVFLYFTACKEFIHELYGPYIFEGEAPELDDEGNVIPTGEESDPDPFKWWGVFFRLAETGVFGDLEATGQTRFHVICQYLMKNKMDADRAKRKMRSSRHHKPTY